MNVRVAFVALMLVALPALQRRRGVAGEADPPGGAVCRRRRRRRDRAAVRRCAGRAVRAAVRGREPLRRRRPGRRAEHRARGTRRLHADGGRHVVACARARRQQELRASTRSAISPISPISAARRAIILVHPSTGVKIVQGVSGLCEAEATAPNTCRPAPARSATSSPNTWRRRSSSSSSTCPTAAAAAR